MQRRPKPRELTPEEREERAIRDEIELSLCGYSSMEEKQAHERQLIEDINCWEAEAEFQRRVDRRWKED